MELFGFTIGRAKSDANSSNTLPSFVPPNIEDGSSEIATGGAYGMFVDIEGKTKNEANLVTKYRQMSAQPECDSAIQDIVNEAIVVDDDDDQVVDIILDETDLPDSIKTKIREEFEHIKSLLKFRSNAYDIFRKWYVDGRLFYHIMVDNKNPRQGIKELRNIDPRKIKKVRELKKSKDQRTGAEIFSKIITYYIYNPKGVNSNVNPQGIRISPDAICYVHSGIMDESSNMVYSNLHKAIKPLNQLNMLENAVVIYRLARAPERRIFYIDVGNLPKMKAEQYLRDMMIKHKNKLTYDATTGEVRDDRRFMTMLEDFWLPRREGGRGTEITTLPGGQNLGEMEDVEYFKKKLYKSLNVPLGRLESENTFNVGRSAEITRDEIKFAKFINRLRNRFSMLFDSLLEIQLSLKGIISREEWKKVRQKVSYDFKEDNQYTELKETEMLQSRLQVLSDADQYVGKYFSLEWVRKNVLRLTENDIKEMKKQMKKEEPEMEEHAENEQEEQGGEPPEEEDNTPIITDQPQLMNKSTAIKPSKKPSE